MNITAVLRDSFNLVKRHAVVFVPMLALFVVIILLSLLFLGTLFPFGSAQDFGEISKEEAFGLAGMTFLGGFIVMLISGFLGLLAHGMTIAMVDEAKKQETTSLKSGWQKTRGKLVGLISASLLVSIVVSIGFLLLVLPGLIAVFFLMFVITAAMVDEVNGIQAFGRGVRTVVKNLKTTLVLFLVLIALGVLFGLLSMILGLIPILGVVLTIVVSAVFGVYTTAFLVLSYNSLEPAPENPPEAKA
jgi:magnesium-transporting ATPase (P-type)